MSHLDFTRTGLGLDGPTRVERRSVAPVTLTEHDAEHRKTIKEYVLGIVAIVIEGPNDSALNRELLAARDALERAYRIASR